MNENEWDGNDEERCTRVAMGVVPTMDSDASIEWCGIHGCPVAECERDALKAENERLREFVRRVTSHFAGDPDVPEPGGWVTVGNHIAEDLRWLLSSVSASGTGKGAVESQKDPGVTPLECGPDSKAEAEDPPRCIVCNANKGQVGSRDCTEEGNQHIFPGPKRDAQE